MRTSFLFMGLLLLGGCGGSVERAAIGEPCADSSECSADLVCTRGRGSSLCLPRQWFNGGEGAWCFTPADCGAGKRCDTTASPNPIADGVCRADEG